MDRATQAAFDGSMNSALNQKGSARTVVQAVCSALAVTATMFLAACADRGGFKSAADHTDVAGVYMLVSVDGKEVPATVSHDGATLEVRSGQFIINADGTCTSRMVFVPPSGAEATREVKATYTRNGAKLHMTWERAGRTIGTVNADTFTMNNEGMILAYRK